MKNYLSKAGGGIISLVAAILSVYYLSSFLSNYLLEISVVSGIIGSLLFLGVLLVKRSIRRRKIDLLARISLYKDFTPAEFEEVTAEIFRQKDYKAKVTGKTGDLGIDVILSKNGEKIGMQCKHYKDPIGPSMIREFVGALEGEGLKKGFFVTTSHFTSGAKEAAQRTNLNLELINGQALGHMRNQIDANINIDLIPSRRWGEMSPFARTGLLIFLLVDIAAFLGGAVYLLLTG